MSRQFHDVSASLETVKLSKIQFPEIVGSHENQTEFCQREYILANL